MLLSAERPFVGAFAVCIPGATLLHCIGLVHAVLPASDWNIANEQLRFPRNLGDPDASSANPGRRYRVTNSWPWRRTRPPKSEHNECNRGIAKRRKRSAARWAAGSHSVLIVPTKLANFTPLEPVEGSETSNHGTVFGKHDECLEIRKTCTRNRNG